LSVDIVRETGRKSGSIGFVRKVLSNSLSISPYQFFDKIDFPRMLFLFFRRCIEVSLICRSLKVILKDIDELPIAKFSDLPLRRRLPSWLG